MKIEVRILFLLAAAALVAGWLGLRHTNAAMEARVAMHATSAEGSR